MVKSVQPLISKFPTFSSINRLANFRSLLYQFIAKLASCKWQLCPDRAKKIPGNEAVKHVVTEAPISNMAAKVARNFVAKSVSQFEMPQTGIPIIIRPFVVKKAYVVHPKVTSFQADLKAQWLTKTCLRKGLPTSINTEVDFMSNKQLKFIKERMEKSILHTTVSQKIGMKWKMQYEDDLLEALLPSFFLQFWHLTHDSLRDGFLDFRPCIKTHWCRNFGFYQTTFSPGFVLRSKTPLPLFEEDINSTITADLPGPYNCVDLGIFRHPTIHLPNSPGYKPDLKTPHPATMILSDFMSRNQEQMVHHGIHAMFGQLVAMAMRQGYYPGQHLEKPLTTKCVITNGRIFMFMAYQLNTLSLQEDFGIKNIAWFEDFKTMYNVDLDPFGKGCKTFYEVLPTETKSLELDEACIKTLVAFITQMAK